MTVNDKRGAIPEIGPEGTFRIIGALARPSFAVDHLHPGDHRSRLLLPRFAGEKSGVDEDRVQLRDLVGQQHGLEIGPVLGAQLGEGRLVVLLQKVPVFGAPIVQQSQLVVAEKRDGVGGPGQIDDLDAVGPAIDQIAQ